MARFLPVQKDAATDAARAVYAEIEKDFGFVPNLFKTLASSAAFLEAIYNLHRLIMGPLQMRERTRNLVVLKVAKANKSDYLVNLYRPFAVRSGISEEEIKALDDHEKSDLFSYDEKLAMSYADMVTHNPLEVSGDFFKFLKNHYTQQQVIEMTAIIGFFTMLDRFSRALEVDIEKK